MGVMLEVVIPVLMPSKYLPNLQELLRNSCNQIRIVYVLDYKDGTAEHEDNIFSNSSGELFLRGSYGSPGNARNAGLEVCTSEYICFWDSDDLPQLENLCITLCNFTHLNPEVVIGKWNTVQNRGEVQGSRPIDIGLNPGLWRCIFKRSAIGSTRFTSLLWGEDQVFLAQILAKNIKVLVVDEILYTYRQNSIDSLTSKKHNSKDLQQASRICQEILSHSSNSNLLVITFMLFRQSISMIKFGNGSTKLHGIKVLAISLMIFLKKVNWKTFFSSYSEWK